MASQRRNEVKWTKSRYNLKKFTKNYRLPQIVNVVGGWCGADEHETISAGQILRVDRKFDQRRVVAEDDLGRHISIPVNYKFKFNIIPASEDTNKTYTIEEVLATFTLPQKIQLAKEGGMFVSVDGAKKTGYRFGVLNLVRTHAISYLVCNSMNSGGIVKQPLILPMYITIEVVVAEGLVKGTKKQWENYQRLRTQIVESNVNLEEVTGIEDISIYGSVEVSVKRKANLKEQINIYEEIEPKIVQISTSGKEKTHEEDKHDAASRPYEDIDIIEVPPDKPDRPVSCQDGPYTPLVHEFRGQYERLNRRSLPLPDESAYDVIDQVTDNRPPVAPKPKKSITFPHGGRSGPLPPRPRSRKSPPSGSPAPVVEYNPMRVFPVQPGSGGRNVMMTGFPEELGGLGIDEVGDCLRELNLGQYAHTFKENDVDGHLLSGLSVDILEHDLGMNQLHAMKLEKFIKGWRPRYK